MNVTKKNLARPVFIMLLYRYTVQQIVAKRWVQEAINEFESMKEMKGINGGGKIPKADATEQKKSSQELVKETVEESNKPTVKSFLSLLKGLFAGI